MSQQKKPRNTSIQSFNEAEEEKLPLKQLISRLFYIVSVRAGNTDDINTINILHTALTMLDYSLKLVDHDERQARRIYNQARKIAKKKIS